MFTGWKVEEGSMRLTARRLVVGGLVAVAVAGCSDAGAPDPTDAFLTDAALLGIAAGQASMPGLLMDGSGDPDRTPPCTFVAASGRFECVPQTREGITISRSFALYDAEGNVQSARGAGTSTMNTQVTASGTRVSRHGEMSVQRSSDMTVSGLGADSPRRTFNGAETGTFSGTRATDRGSMTSTETFESVTDNVVRPTDRVAGRYPLSGSISRSATSSTSFAGGPARTRSMSEVITFNGTNLVTVVITRDGISRTCTRDLSPRTTDAMPGDRMVCN